MNPQAIGRYQIKAEIGRGGMATVYRGYDPRFKREVAIKVLPREFLHDPNFRARFDREAEVIAALEHPAIVPVYDYGEEDGQPYIVMRLMTGGSLSDRLERGPLSLTDTAHIFDRLAPALDRAHTRGIIHRDLKPGNILFDDDDNPYISDFGIAKLAGGSSTFTGSGVVGTPAYMSPEQARGEKHIDGRSDIYALGAIVFQMLTGKFPYEADTPMGIIVKHITDPVPHILDANDNLPAGCDDLIQKAMAKRPADRFPKAVDMARTLDTIAQESPASGPTPAAVSEATPRPYNLPTIKGAEEPPAYDTTGIGRIEQQTTEIAEVEEAAFDSQTGVKEVAPEPAAMAQATPASTRAEMVAEMPPAAPTVASEPAKPRPPVQAPKRRAWPRWIIAGVVGALALVGLLLCAVMVVIRQMRSAQTAQPQATTVGIIATLTDLPIAFASNRDGNFEIYTKNLDDSSLTRITNNPADDLYPTWSGDGSKLAFASNRDGNFEIYISDSAGLTRVTNNPADDLYPTWSGDGSKLAFASNRDGNFEIYISDSTGLTRITNNPADDLYPTWSGDGSKLAFASNRDGNFEIYISDSTGLTRVTNNPADDLYPKWSDDGSKLAFASNRDGNFEIYISDSNGLTRVTNNPAEDLYPAWSADGSRLAFASDRDGNFNIYVSDSTGLTRVTDDRAEDTKPGW